MSKLSRRALVVSASSLPAFAIPTASLAAPANPRDRQAIIGRAEQMVEILRGRFVCAGWHEKFDTNRAAAFLEAVRQEDYNADYRDEAGQFVDTWMIDHGQSFDWLYLGNPVGLIAGAAHRAFPTLPTVSDDTSDRMAEHRQCQSLVNDICRRMGNLQGELPEERRKAYSVFDRGSDVGKDDDPRWTAVQAEYWSASDRLRELAWSFVDRPPTTVAGVAAVLSYAEEYEEAGGEWPDARILYTASGRYLRHDEEDWRRSLDRAIAMQFGGPGAMMGIAAVAAPVSSTESRLFELERQVAAAEAAAVEAGHPHTEAEKAMFAWERQNPRPKPREVSTLKETLQLVQSSIDEEEGQIATPAIVEKRAHARRLITEKMADADREHAEALKSWEVKHSIARANCHYDEREALYQRLLDEADAIRDEAAGIPANTIEGLRCKARMLSEADYIGGIGSGSLVASIVDQLRQS